MKKNIFFILFLIAIPFTSFEQANGEPVAAYKKNPAIPEFKIVETRDTTATFIRDSLPKHKQVVIIYFSPDCSHCQYEATEIVKNMDKLKHVFFVWINYHQSLKALSEFSEKYKLNQFSNVVVGKETSYKTAVFYQIEFTPFIAIYNSKGIFKKEFRTGAKPEELIEALK